MSLNPWGDRWAPEEANHFNPAYCGVLIYEFIRAYARARKVPASYALVFCALPIVLHPATRNRLPRPTVTRLLPWLEENRDVRVGFADRARNLRPYVREALRYGDQRATRFVLETAAWLLPGQRGPHSHKRRLTTRQWMFARPSMPFEKLHVGSPRLVTRQLFLRHGEYAYELHTAIRQRLQY